MDDSSTDWRDKYNEMADMLAETRAELDDFHGASKELEAELENELARTEKAQQDLKIKVAKAEAERDEWKNKFMSLQTNHNTTTTSLQRELDKLRQDHQQIKVQLRELEMGNDDLERTERAVSSSLADAESKYSRALEEKILLEHELLDKANCEEQCQRFKDELRDANAEISALKDQLLAAATASPDSSASSIHSSHSSESSTHHTPTISNDDLLNTPPPADLQLSDLDPSTDSLLSDDEEATPRKPTPSRTTGQSILLQRAGLSTPPKGIPRSSSIPSPYSSTPRTPQNRPSPVTRKPSVASTTSKSKGVQMVSEMRARVKTLEQKIHTRVPRLRMGSNAPRPNGTPTPSAIPSPPFNKSILARSSWENPLSRKSSESKRSQDSDKEKDKKSADSTGWVLIMEDSPSPRKEDTDRRRLSSPSRSTSQRGVASTSSSPTSALANFPSGIKRPQSRLSATTSSTWSSSTISRPSTPTFLPLPSNGSYSGLPGQKRSTGPASTSFIQPKRSSLGSSTAAMPPPSDVPRPRPASGSAKSPREVAKALPSLPSGLPLNVTMRSSSRLPTTSSSTSLAQSRIGRPSGGSGGALPRRGSDAADPNLTINNLRPRSGSSAGTYGRSVT
ncbi:hypothetical protein BDZ89DRAFT_1089761 [Hymenopellis radicata]|nr:hypothetical protein BDZ89DRAFT_1089761 [Hymenopellis radicata]